MGNISPLGFIGVFRPACKVDIVLDGQIQKAVFIDADIGNYSVGTHELLVTDAQSIFPIQQIDQLFIIAFFETIGVFRKKILTFLNIFKVGEIDHLRFDDLIFQVQLCQFSLNCCSVRFHLRKLRLLLGGKILHVGRIVDALGFR